MFSNFRGLPSNRQRQARRFVPESLQMHGNRLEPRISAAYLYRLNPTPFFIFTQINDWSVLQLGGFEFDSDSVQASSTKTYHDNDNDIDSWDQTAEVTNTIIDSNSYTSSATRAVEVVVSHLGQGTATPISGPGPNNGYASAVFHTVASTGRDPSGQLNWISWQLATPDPVTHEPTNGALPANESVMVTFSYNYTSQNAENTALPHLELRSTFVNIFINSNNVQGIEITSVATGNVLYSDTEFGTAGTTSGNTFVDSFPVSNAGPVVIGLGYQSDLGSAQEGRPIAQTPQPNPAQPNPPDTSYYHDGFDWNITFAASA